MRCLYMLINQTQQYDIVAKWILYAKNLTGKRLCIVSVLYQFSLHYFRARLLSDV